MKLGEEMFCFYNADSFCSVRRSCDHQIIAQTHYSTTDIEVKVLVRCDVTTFKINQAVWEIYRSPNKKQASREEIPGLKGIEAYFGCGAALKANLAGEMAKLKHKLFAETITSIIQSEVYLLSERGYTSLAAYDQFWDQMYANSCRYYSNLDQVTCKLMDYVNDTGSLSTLFSRHRHVNIYGLGDGKLNVNGVLNDCFHEMNVLIRINTVDLTLESILARAVRVPDPVCRDAALFACRLRGKRLKTINIKELAGIMGAEQGCHHLINLTYDSISTALNFLVF